VDALSVLEKLRQGGYQTLLLSGDSEEATLSMGHKLGFQNKDIYFLMSPAQKAHLVKKCPNSMMIGDGINDSLALMQAEVSVATTGAVDAALKSAAVYVTNSQLAPIAALFDISREAIFGIRTNLLVAVIYNTVTGSLALAGFINPLVAALLMPVSSGIILASTWLRSRR
ncbi:MAG: HAD-IC family P-type ATPase, partial [Bdellovibrionota bacterium]